jgi:hypothetical protein
MENFEEIIKKFSNVCFTENKCVEKNGGIKDVDNVIDETKKKNLCLENLVDELSLKINYCNKLLEMFKELHKKGFINLSLVRTDNDDGIYYIQFNDCKKILKNKKYFNNLIEKYKKLYPKNINIQLEKFIYDIVFN